MKDSKFYVCSHCGNVVEMVKDKGVPVVCCGQKMDELVPNATEASGEKHLPEVRVENGVVKVCVGTVNHPMQDEHYIEWVSLQTDRGSLRKSLRPGDEPTVVFRLDGDQPLAVYAYCNLHGLWMTRL